MAAACFALQNQEKTGQTRLSFPSASNRTSNKVVSTAFAQVPLPAVLLNVSYSPRVPTCHGHPCMIRVFGSWTVYPRLLLFGTLPGAMKSFFFETSA